MSLAQAIVKSLPGLSDLKKEMEDRALIEELDKLFNAAKNDRLAYERQWMINLAFYLGHQWLYWNESTRRLQAYNRDQWRVHATVNLVKGTVRTEYAKLIQQRPEAKTQPASDDPDDQNQAKVCDAILEYLWSKDGSEGSVKRALLWAVITGTGILKAYWDKVAGDALVHPDTTLETQVVEQVGPDGLPVLIEQQVEVPHPEAGQVVLDDNKDPVHLGEIAVTECSPFEFYPDPFGLTMDQKSWCFTEKLRSVEYVMDRWGVEVEPKELASDQYIEGQIASILGKDGQTRKGVAVREFFRRSSKKYPKGQHVAYVDGKILSNKANPSPKAQLPYVSFVHVPVPGQFWGESMVSDLIDPQKNINKGASQIREQRNLMMKGKWIVYKQALDVGKTITSLPGEIIEVNPIPGVSKPVEQIAGIPIAEAAFREQEQSLGQFRTVSGVNEVSNADAPTGVTAAKAIGYLQEQDDLRLGPTAQDHETAIAALAMIKLRLAKQYYDEPRTARIAGPNNTIKVIEFYKDDIPDDVDVKVEAGSSLPKSRVARQAFLTDLWKEKVITDPRILLRMLELGDIQGLYEDINRDIAQAERENEAMKNGEPREAHTYDNHSIHAAEHRKFRVSEEHERLPTEMQALFDAHEASHIQIAMTSPAPALGLGPGAPTGPVGGDHVPPDLAAQAAVTPEAMASTS